MGGTSARIRAHLTVVLCGGLLMGCGLAHQAQLNKDREEADARRAAGEADCIKRYPDKHRKPVSPRVKCINDVMLAYFTAIQRTVGAVDLDLVNAHHAQRLVAAERYDTGKTSAVQFEAEVAKLVAEFRTEAASRRNSAAMASAAQQQAAAASQQAVLAQQKAISDAFQVPKPVTCTTIGNSMTCR